MRKEGILCVLCLFFCLIGREGNAQEPCKTADVKAGEGSEKCKPDWSKSAPVRFDFHDDAKKDDSEKAPCKTADVKVGEGSEKCKPDWSKSAPVRFDFHDDAKKDTIKTETKPETKKIDDLAETDGISRAETEAAFRSEPSKSPRTCTYTAYAWDTRNKRTTKHFNVSKDYQAVRAEERDPVEPKCTICEEDQAVLDLSRLGLSKLGTVRVCRVYAAAVEQALKEIVESGAFDIVKLEGYRPGRTRGAIDGDGLRTQWSQHSFGTALDINANYNAIYSHCENKLTHRADEVKHCKKGIGGAWQPEKYPRFSIVKDGVVYRAMTKFWKWGGEIDGATKDVMHFSVTGY